MAKKRFLFFVAVHAFFIKDGQVALLKRKNTGYRDGYYGVPAGHVDGGETIAAAMSREVFEEVGITIAAESLQPVHVMHRIVSQTEERIDYFYSIDAWKGQLQNTEPDKCDELGWYPLNVLPENTIPYVKKALAKTLNNEFFSEHNGD